jgi:hypothetical protein
MIGSHRAMIQHLKEACHLFPRGTQVPYDRDLGPVGRSATEPRFFRLATVSD